MATPTPEAVTGLAPSQTSQCSPPRSELFLSGVVEGSMIALNVPRIAAVSLVAVFVLSRVQTASVAHAARSSAEELAKYRDKVIFSNWLS